jgi:glutathione S-transferase
MSSEPTGLKASKGLELLTAPTPNGYKISVLLEELKDAYGLDYTWQPIDIMKNTQKEAWFIAHGPNGRIPVLVDHDRNISVMEGASILSYLTRHFDPEHKFSFAEEPHLTDQEQWIAWQHGGLGPMQGQANHFYRYAKERIPYATQRYVGEAERLYGVLDKRLEGRDFIAGPGKGSFSIADMASIGWVNSAKMSGLEIDMFPNVVKWFDRCYGRPAVQRGMAIPRASPYGVKQYDETVRNDPEMKKKEDDLKEHLRKAKEQYGYKYQSP